MYTKIDIESSAIVAVLSVIVSYVTFRKSSNLKYITKEREKWREAIRKIATQLEVCPFKKRGKILTELKIRINAYGSVNKGKLNDAHIWAVIGKIEQCKKKEYVKLREQLICQLSALLKYDWERSKKEVQGEPLRMVRLLCIIATPIFLMLSLIYYYNDHLMKMFPTIILIAAISCVVMGMIEITVKEGLILNKSWCIAVYTGAEVVMVIVVIIAAFHIPKEIRNGYMGVACLTGVLAIGLRLMQNLQRAIDNNTYSDCVKKIEEKYSNKK